jgi:hypothetical protein
LFGPNRIAFRHGREFVNGGTHNLTYLRAYYHRAAHYAPCAFR